jgi:hypothetical protein
MITAIAFNREIGSKMAINLFYPKDEKGNMKNHKKFLKLISDDKIQKIAEYLNEKVLNLDEKDKKAEISEFFNFITKVLISINSNRSKNIKSIEELELNEYRDKTELLKYIMCDDSEVFVQAFARIFKEKYLVDSVSNNALNKILSMYSDKPDFDGFKSIFQFPHISYCDFPYLLA